MIKYSLLFTTVLLFGLSACKKDAGEGGTSTIRGKVIVHEYSISFDSVVAVYPAPDEDVYIIYGADHSTYDNDFKTSFDGTYNFKYLQKGKYKMFAYSKDTTGAYNGTLSTNKPKIPVFTEVEIDGKGKTIDAPEIIIMKIN